MLWLPLLLCVSQSTPEQQSTPQKPIPLRADRNGVYHLLPIHAKLKGDGLALQVQPSRLVGWPDPLASATWSFTLPKSGDYLLVVDYAAPSGQPANVIEFTLDEKTRQAFVSPTGSATTFLPRPVQSSIPLSAGDHQLSLMRKAGQGAAALAIQRVSLVPDLP